MTDALFAVARGAQYAGRATLQGPVFYLTGEGVTGFKRRLVAMRRHYGVEGHRVPFFMIQNVPDLGSERTDLNHLLNELDAFITDNGLPAPRVIALDTVARCMGEGDENTARDMGRFIRRCSFIERIYGCLVAVVHHTGKDPTRGGRGSNALNGAADVTWEVEAFEKFSRVTVTESKDGPSGVSWTFGLQPFDLGDRNSAETPDPIDEDLACVVEILTEPTFGKMTRVSRNTRRLPDDTKRLLDILKKAATDAGELGRDSFGVPHDVRSISRKVLKTYADRGGWFDEGRTDDANRSLFSRHLNRLSARELIGLTKEFVWLNQQ